MSDQAPRPDDQHEIIAFLSYPSSYPAHPDRVDRRETHGALIFLAGDEVIKIKRAVRYSYMDFSTLAKRHAVCLREVEINARFAPEIYLGCIAIRRGADGSLSLDGPGEAVEWAVRMRRFHEDDLLSRIAEARGIDPPLAKALADTVFSAHQAAERSMRRNTRWLESLVASVSGSLASHRGVLPPQDVEQFGTGLRQQMVRSTPILETRAAQGFVRRCHGDLHLENIVIWRGRPTLFDAIEFDEELATIDTLYDLAFLLMDLDFRGQRTAGNVVLNRYLWRSGSEQDLAGLAALPVFMALRAGVRAMVAADRLKATVGGARDQDAKLAERYLRLALSYLRPEKPRLIAVGGPSGTGKSTLAATLAPAIGRSPGAVHLRSDLERKSLAGAEETERLPSQWYAQAATGDVYRILRYKAQAALAAGQSVIVDAVHGRAEEQSAMEALAEEMKVPFAGLWLSAAAEELVRRVETRRGDASDATAEVVRQQISSFITQPPPSWVQVSAAGDQAKTLAEARIALDRIG